MIEGLGRFRAPLGTIRLNGETKLIVNPWAAIGTDALLLTTSLATLFLAKNGILKAVGVIGGIWGTTAMTLEIAKLVTPSEQESISREF